MQNTQIVVNQIVHLNSGSPDLKVVSVEENNVTVEWQDVKIERAVFPRACLNAD